jgi:RHS repeat-associated protein
MFVRNDTMTRPASLIAGMLGVWLSLLAAIPAQAGPTGCIYIWRFLRMSYPCPTPTGCGSPCYCSFGEYCYTPSYQVLDCATGEPTSSCSSTAENEAYQAWRGANVPVGAEQCENPWSGVFIGCNQAPEPTSCQDTVKKVNDLGDPVDLTTGALEQSATDIELGHGLAFKRHFASNRGVTTAMGKDWRHNLDWQLVYKVTVTSGQYQEIVIVRRPFGSDGVFERNSWHPDDWKTGANGVGGLAGSEPDGFTFTGDDGTKIQFERVSSQTFRLAQIRPPGEPAIAVTYSGATKTFSAGGSSIAITEFTSGSNTGQIQTVAGGGQTWTYTYSSSLDQLLTATGPDLSTPGNGSDQVVLTYSYPYGPLSKVQRTAGGVTRTLGEWTIVGGRATTADEVALDQKLYMTYSGTQYVVTGTAVRDVPGTSATPLASFSCDGGRITGVSGTGGPGVDVPLSSATFTSAAAGSVPPNFWQSKTDENGHKTWYQDYDERGRAATIVEGWVDSNSNGTFDTSDAYLRRRDFTYHASLDDPLSVTEKSLVNPAANRVETQIFDSSDRLTTKRLAGYTLDASGAVVAFTDETTYGYDANGRMTSITGPTAAQYTEIDYDATTGSRSALRRYLNGSGSSYLSWSFSNFDAQGNPQTVTDPNSRATAFTYDGMGRVLTATPPYEGSGSTTVTFTYDVDGNLTRVDFPPDTASNAVYLKLEYDTTKPDLLRAISDSQGNAIVYTYGKKRATREERYTGFTSLASPGTRVGDATFSYSAAGHLFRAFNPLFGGSTVYSEFGHDAKGNPTSVTDENGKQDALLYDALDRLEAIQQVRSATYETDFAYDALSNVTEVTDAAANATDLLYDDRGNLVETVSPDTGTTRFLYDAAGNLARKIEDAAATARSTLYSYDGLDRLTAIDLPNDPDWTFTYDTSAASNQKGRLAQVTNGAVTTQLEYTQRGDLAVERTIVDGLSYAVQYAYDAAGNRTQVQGPSGTHADTSYAGLRPSAMTVTAGTSTQQITNLTWYPFGPRTQAKFPPQSGGANTVTSTRALNLRGQITDVDVTSGAAAILDRSYKYDFTAGTPGPNDPGPNLDRLVDNLDASESRFYFYDALDRLQKATSLTGTVLHEYGYDAVGNRASKLGPIGSSSYSYESNTNRLDATTGAEARDYAHDVYGSRIYDGAAGFTGTPSLLYDDANRLIEVRDPAASFATIATYSYDAFGRRIKKVAGGKTILFFYDSEGHLIEEIEKIAGSGNDEARFYVFLEDELVGIVDQTQEAGAATWIAPLLGVENIEPPVLIFVLVLVAGLGVTVVTRRLPAGLATTTSGAALMLLCASGVGAPRFSWVHVDPLGTPAAVTDTPASGNAVAVWRAKVEPFGKATVDDDPDGNAATFALNVRFPGQYADAETGWYFNFFRTYDPSTGRYLEPDPIGLKGNPSAFLYDAAPHPLIPVSLGFRDGHTYAYAGSNPLGVADPLGLGTWSSFSVGGSLGPITFKWTSEKPLSTQNEFVTDFELGGGISFCYTPDPPCHGERPRLPFNFNVGIGRWTGISTAGERLCINVGASASFLPIDISIPFFDAPPFGSPPSAWER